MHYKTKASNRFPLAIVAALAGIETEGQSDQPAPPLYFEGTLPSPLLGIPGDWSIGDFDENHLDSLAQPAVFNSNMNGLKVLNILSGVAFLKENEINVHVSRMKPNTVWYPFPTPYFDSYDALLQHPTIRPLPGLIVYEFNDNNTAEVDRLVALKNSYTELCKISLIIKYAKNYIGNRSLVEFYQYIALNVHSVIVGTRNIDDLITDINNDLNSDRDGVLDLVFKPAIKYDDREGKTDRIDWSTVSQVSDLLNVLIPEDNDIQDYVNNGGPYPYKKIGIMAESHIPVGVLNTNQSVSIRSKDWRCYGHPFVPLAIINDSTINGLGNLNDYDGAYLRSDLPTDLSNMDLTGITNYYSSLLSRKTGGYDETKTNWGAVYSETEYRYRFDDEEKDVLCQDKIVLKRTDNSLLVVDLDAYEKWSLYKSSIRTIYSHWIMSGFLAQDYWGKDAVARVIAQRFRRGVHIESSDINTYLAQPYAYDRANNSVVTSYTKGSTTVELPEPNMYTSFDQMALDYDTMIKNVVDGRTLGDLLKNGYLDLSDVKMNIEEANATDYMANSALRPFKTTSGGLKDFRSDLQPLLTAYGFEEFSARVPCKEVPNILTGRISAGALAGNSGDNMIETLELLKAKMIMSRSYLHSRMRFGGRIDDVHNGIKVDIKATENWQAMALGNYNSMVRSPHASIEQRDKRRLALEEALYETWGQVLTHKGYLVEAQFTRGGGEGTRRALNIFNSVGEAKEVHEEYDALRRVYTPIGAGNAGFTQLGGEALLNDAHLSSHQLLHWYYFGCQVVSNWGLGRHLSHHPKSNPVDSNGDDVEPTAKNAFPWLRWRSGDLIVPLPKSRVWAENDMWRYHDPDDDILDSNDNEVLTSNVPTVSVTPDSIEFRMNGDDWLIAPNVHASSIKNVTYQFGETQSMTGFIVSRLLLFKICKVAFKSSNHNITIRHSVGSLTLTSDSVARISSFAGGFNNFATTNQTIDSYGPTELIISIGGNQLSEDLLNECIGEDRWIELQFTQESSKYSYLVMN